MKSTKQLSPDLHGKQLDKLEDTKTYNSQPSTTETQPKIPSSKIIDVGSDYELQPLTRRKTSEIITDHKSFIESLENQAREIEENKLAKNQERNKSCKNYKSRLNTKKVITFAFCLTASLLAVVAASLLSGLPLLLCLCVTAALCIFAILIYATQNSKLPEQLSSTINTDIFKKQTLDIMKSLFEDIGDEKISAEQYRKIATKFTELSKNEHNDALINNLIDLIFSQRKHLDRSGIDEKKWMLDYTCVIARVSQDIFKTFFAIVENSIEDKEILKLVHHKKLLILFDENQVSTTFVDNIFKRYLKGKTIFIKQWDHIQLIRKATIQGFTEGISKYKKTLPKIKS